MELMKFFGSLGLNINEADVAKVDALIRRLRKDLKSLTAEVKIKTAPITEMAAKARNDIAAQVGKGPSSSELAAQENSLRLEIRSLRDQMAVLAKSSDKASAAQAKLIQALLSLEAVLKAQGKLPKASETKKEANSLLRQRDKAEKTGANKSLKDKLAEAKEKSGRGREVRERLERRPKPTMERRSDVGLTRRKSNRVQEKPKPQEKAKPRSRVDASVKVTIPGIKGLERSLLSLSPKLVSLRGSIDKLNGTLHSMPKARATPPEPKPTKSSQKAVEAAKKEREALRERLSRARGKSEEGKKPRDVAERRGSRASEGRRRRGEDRPNLRDRLAGRTSRSPREVAPNTDMVRRRAARPPQAGPARRPAPTPEERRDAQISRTAKTQFGYKQGSVRNAFQEIALSTEIATGKLNTALINVQALRRNASKFTDTEFKIEGFRNALSSVNSDLAAQVRAITTSSKSQRDQLNELAQLAQQVERRLAQTFQSARSEGLTRVNARAVQEALSGFSMDPQTLRARSLRPAVVEDTISSLETRSQSRGGFRSPREQEDLLRATETRRRQLLIETERLVRDLSSSETATRERAARDMNRIQRDMTRISQIENRARARQVLDANTQARMSFRSLANQAFMHLNSIRIAATTATGAMASFLGIRPFIEANKDMQQITSAFEAITGSSAGASDAIRFIYEQSGKLGLQFRTTAKAAKSFFAAAMPQGMGMEQSKEIIQGVLEASRVLGLSDDDIQGTIRALSQMMGKVVVSAEELRQQLGERLPNAIPLAAKAMYGSAKATDKLFKAMAAGTIKATDLLPKLAKELKAFAAGGLSSAMKALPANIERLKNVLFKMLVGMGESGGLDVVTSVIRTLTNTLEGMLPVLNRITYVASKALMVILAPIEALSHGLLLLKKVDAGLKSITDGLLDLVRASEGFKTAVSEVFNTQNLAWLLILTPVLKKLVKSFRWLVAFIPGLSRLTAVIRSTGAALATTALGTGALSAAVSALTVKLAALGATALAMARKIALPLVAIALAIEDIVAVTNPAKDSLIKLGVSAEGIFGGIVRSLSTGINAAILALDYGISRLINGVDLSDKRFKEQVEDLFKIKIKPGANSDEIWAAFWDEAKMRAAADESITGFVSFMGLTLGEGLTNIGNLFAIAFTDPIGLVKSLWEGLVFLVEDGYTYLKGAIPSLANDVMDTITGKLTEWKDKVKELATGIGKAIASALSGMIPDWMRRAYIWASGDKSEKDNKVLSVDTYKPSEASEGQKEMKARFGFSEEPSITERLPNLDTLSRFTGTPMITNNNTSKSNLTVAPVINQTINPAPGMDEVKVGNIAADAANKAIKKVFIEAAVNAPRTE